MKIISVESAEIINSWIKQNSQCVGTYRQEHIRLAIRDQIRNEFLSSDTSRDPDLFHFERQGSKTIRFYEHCINCGELLGLSARNNHLFHKNIEVFKLQFCCSCYEQFKDKTFDKFPRNLIENIQREIKAYKK